MKKIIVTLLSEKPCELSRFLKSYYNKEIIIDENSFKWSKFYNNPVDTVDLISTLIDNNDTYKIEALLTLGNMATIKITDDNLEQLVKLLLR